MLLQTCDVCRRPFHKSGRPARIPMCEACIADPQAEASRLPQRAAVQRRIDAEFDIIWNGGEGLSSGGGCALAGIR